MQKKKEKIVSFPHMGNIYIPLKAILETLGVKVIIPPQNNKKVLDLGVKHSMETICLPYKLNLANYMMALDRGVNTLMMFQAPGSCRFGNYTKMAYQKMKDLGYNFDMVVFDMYKNKMKEVVKTFCKVSGTFNPITVFKAFNLGFEKFYALDEAEELLFYTRPRELEKGSAEKIYKLAKKLIEKTKSARKLKKIREHIKSEFAKIKTDTQKDIPKVFLIGEFFVLLDPYTNMDIEKILGELGIEVQRPIMFSDWISHVLKPGIFYRKESHRQRCVRYAKEFMKRPIGGECIESVGDAVLAAKEGADGVIHLSPFTCTPEIVAQNILNKVSKKEDIPIISLILDEQTGKAGYITRLEAFVDLVKRRRQKILNSKD